MTAHAAAVILREAQAGDLPVFFENQRDPEAIRMAEYPSRALDAFTAHWKKILSTDTCVVRTIMFEGKVAGYVSSWEESGECKLGYLLGREFWGKGIASAALQLFLAEMQTRPLMAYVVKHNAASLRVLQKCGFRISGEGRFAGLNGQDCDEFILALDAPPRV